MGLLAAVGLAAGDDASGPLLTLGEAVRLSLEGNLGAQAAALAVRADDEAISAAHTRHLPVLSARAHAGQLLAPVEIEFRRGVLGNVPGLGLLPGKDATMKSGQTLTAGVTSSLMQAVTQLYTARQGVRRAQWWQGPL